MKRDRISFYKKDNAELSFLSSQLALMIASIILLSVILLFFAGNIWMSQSQLQHNTELLQEKIGDTQSIWLEQTETYTFTSSVQEYQLCIFDDEFMFQTQDAIGRILQSYGFITAEILAQNNTLFPQGVGIKTFHHNYLRNLTNHTGYHNDSIPSIYYEQIQLYITQKHAILALHPITIDTRKPLQIENLIIHYDDERQTQLVLLYQN